MMYNVPLLGTKHANTCAFATFALPVSRTPTRRAIALSGEINRIANASVRKKGM
jgi:hypothetical protein